MNPRILGVRVDMLLYLYRRRLRALSPLLTTKLGVQVFVATERGIFSHGGYGGHGGFFGLSD